MSILTYLQSNSQSKRKKRSGFFTRRCRHCGVTGFSFPFNSACRKCQTRLFILLFIGLLPLIFFLALLGTK